MSIPGSVNPLFLGAAGQATGGGEYQIERSVRFNSPDSAYLSRTPGTAGDRRTFTWAGWVKRCSLSNYQPLFGAVSSTADHSSIFFDNAYENNALCVWTAFGGGFSTGINVKTAAIFRDPSAWYHIIVAVDTNQASLANAVKVWVNGVAQTMSGTYNSGINTYFNSTVVHGVGYMTAAGTYSYLDGYLADVHLLDGIAVTDPSSFGEFDTNGVWQPIDASGLTYGTNGFRLPFSDNSTAAALGTDSSSNGNTWTVNNISVLGTIASPNWSAGLVSSTGSFASGYPAANAFDGNTATGAATSTGGGLSVNLTWTSTNFNSGNPTLRIYTYQNYKIDVNGVTKNADGAGPASLAWVDCGTISGGFSTVVVYGYSGTNSGSYIVAIEVNGQILVGPLVAAGNDSLVDSPVNGSQVDTGVGGEVVGNYATLSPLISGSNVTLSNGNLRGVSGGAGGGTARAAFSTIAADVSQKWYCEVLVGSTNVLVGIIKADNYSVNAYPGETASGYGYYENGQKYNSGTGSSYGATFTTGDIIGIGIDSGSLIFYKNGVSQGAAFTGLSGLYLIGFGSYSNTIDFNFGQRQWAYAAPAGFKALCTTNLPAPVVAKPNEVMDVVTYTGDGSSSSRSITGLSFSPDFVWIKNRSSAYSHTLYDQIRGVGPDIALASNTTGAEGSLSDGSTFGYLSAFNSNGFSIVKGSDATSYVNGSGQAYVAWCWNAGGTTDPSNQAGSITSQVRANASAGFSVCTFTSVSSGACSFGHGLNVTPGFVIVKSRASGNWICQHISTGTQYTLLNSTAAATSDSSVWNSAFTSSIVNIGSGFAGSVNYVAYCFAPVAGYSAMGSYVGNGSSDGPAIWLGFRPRWLLVKNSNNTDGWSMWDAARDPYNEVIYKIEPNSSGAGGSNSVHKFDFLSNGFKVRGTWDGFNGSGNTIIYAAFAESPFAYSRAR